MFKKVVQSSRKGAQNRTRAFSLVEMLMALLVASLLLAALAPVMTKRMDEAKINVSGVGAAQYDKDAIIQIYTGAADEDKVFNVPSDVNMIKATLIGGGGAGGNSFYGKQEITTSKSWTVPNGVTKLRVFMLGGGGGGASGGLGTGTAYENLSAEDSASDLTITNAGVYTFSDQTFTLTRLIPKLNSTCLASGKTKWTLVSDGSEVAPNGYASIATKIPKTASIKLTKTTACGGGGGGADTNQYNNYWAVGGGGGSGGYLANTTLNTTIAASKIFIRVGSGGTHGSLRGGTGGNSDGTQENNAGTTMLPVTQSSGLQAGGSGGNGSGAVLSSGGNGGDSSSKYRQMGWGWGC